MLLYFLTIRFKQTFRLGKELGIVRSIFLLLAFFAVCYLLPKLVDKSPYLICGITLTIIWSVHSQRQDGVFLKLLNIRKARLYFVEYLCISTPVLFALMLSKQYIWLLPVMMVLLYIISERKPFQLKKLRFRNVPLATPLLFEYISGLRTNFLPLAVMYIIALALSFTVFALPVFILLYTFTVCSFNTQCEPRSFIEVFDSPAKTFLLKKIKLQLQFTLLLLLPAIILYCIFNIHYWYILLYIILVCCTGISFSIIYKYALYKPGESLAGNNILNSFAVISFLIPFLIPVVPIMLVKYYNKAIQNLYNYTYA